MRAEDIRYAYAAYRGGAFPRLPRDLSAADFWPTVQRVLASRPGAGLTTLTAQVPERGEIPVGWLIGWPFGGARVVDMHATWAPWATARMRLEASLAFLLRARGTVQLMTVAAGKDRLLERLCARGVARKVGVLRGYFGPRQDGTIFQSVGR